MNKLDALVAEKVMGWTWWGNGKGLRWLVPPTEEEAIKRGVTVWNAEKVGQWQGRKADMADKIASDMRMPRYSTDIAAAWEVVRGVQTNHPGWRFSLLGGDVSIGYAKTKGGKIKRSKQGDPIVDEKSRVPFGWKAEFFGEADPRLCSGQRHGSAYHEGYCKAICLAALMACGVSEEDINAAIKEKS